MAFVTCQARQDDNKWLKLFVYERHIIWTDRKNAILWKNAVLAGMSYLHFICSKINLIIM